VEELEFESALANESEPDAHWKWGRCGRMCRGTRLLDGLMQQMLNDCLKPIMLDVKDYAFSFFFSLSVDLELRYSSNCMCNI